MEAPVTGRMKLALARNVGGTTGAGLSSLIGRGGFLFVRRLFTNNTIRSSQWQSR